MMGRHATTPMVNSLSAVGFAVERTSGCLKGQSATVGGSRAGVSAGEPWARRPVGGLSAGQRPETS
jgi:hypothetical protein